MTVSSIPAPTAAAQSFAVPVGGRGLIAATTGFIVSATAGSAGGIVEGSAPGTQTNPNFVNQITVSEHHHDDSEIVQHPIETGSPITDHAFAKPAELTLNVIWTPNKNTPGTTKNYLQGIYAALLSGKNTFVLYTVYTTKRTYLNMLIKSLATETDPKNQFILEISIYMQEIILASTGISSSVPAAANSLANAPANQDTQQQGQVQLVTPSSGSLLVASPFTVNF
jgi:hypothetical protein